MLEFLVGLVLESQRAFQELWRRIAFSVAIHNTAVRSSGVSRATLSAACGAQRVTSIGGSATPADDVRALLTYADSFSLTRQQAAAILREVADAARGWTDVARRNKIAEAEINRFRPNLEETIAVVADAS